MYVNDGAAQCGIYCFYYEEQAVIRVSPLTGTQNHRLNLRIVFVFHVMQCVANFGLSPFLDTCKYPQMRQNTVNKAVK